ncbi:MAG TPA: flagellar protein FliT [Thiolapillus brandeum]|uniref:Flagellar protein FliT n=1 Tax=Thiolapillus brandeum TaxID=1076588 RepID=A0A831RXC4_9GAMM|nr:flagellar protein FliT [Thiolapillus brandeum]
MSRAKANSVQVSSMSGGRSQALDALLENSLKMLRLAESEDWLDVIQTGILRKQMIDDFFETPVSAGEENDVARVLRRMLQINEEIEEMAVHSRGGLGENIGAIQQGRRAVTAYSENTASALARGSLE